MSYAYSPAGRRFMTIPASVLCYTLLGSVSASAEVKPEQRLIDLFEENAGVAHNILRKERARLIDVLVGHIRDSETPRSMARNGSKWGFAVRMLGELRADQAVTTLVVSMGEVSPHTGSFTSPDPVLVALEKIGYPAMWQVAVCAGSASSGFTRWRCRELLRKTLGSATLPVLKTWHAEETDPKTSEALGRTIREMQDTKTKARNARDAGGVDTTRARRDAPRSDANMASELSVEEDRREEGEHRGTALMLLSDAVSEMKGMENEALVALAIKLAVERRQLGRTLIQRMNATRSKDVKACSAYLLGQYRIAEAAQDLAAAITLDMGFSKQKKLPLWGQYPVVQALVEIGQPSVPYMIRNLEESDDAKIRELSLTVLRHVVGPETAAFLIRSAMEQQEDVENRDRLDSALTALEPALRSSGDGSRDGTPPDRLTDDDPASDAPTSKDGE